MYIATCYQHVRLCNMKVHHAYIWCCVCRGACGRVAWRAGGGELTRVRKVAGSMSGPDICFFSFFPPEMLNSVARKSGYLQSELDSGLPAFRTAIFRGVVQSEEYCY